MEEDEGKSTLAGHTTISPLLLVQGKFHAKSGFCPVLCPARYLAQGNAGTEQCREPAPALVALMLREACWAGQADISTPPPLPPGQNQDPQDTFERQEKQLFSPSRHLLACLTHL